MQFAKISPRLEIHSRLIRMENTFLCLRDCWSPHDLFGLVSHTSNRLMRSCNCAFEGPSAFQLCRCAMRLLPHPRINQSKAESIPMETPSSVAMSDPLGFSLLMHKSVQGRIHSDGNSFLCMSNECRRFPGGPFFSTSYSGLIILVETASGSLSGSNPTVWKRRSLQLRQHCGLLPPHQPFLIHRTNQPTAHGASSLRQAMLD